MDPYQSCPCGSGKSFKWCCQAYFDGVQKARNLLEQGQHEASMQAMAQLVQKHPGNAQLLAYQAEILYLNEKADEADETLQKALDINPDLPLGHWLRGVIRRDEGEVVGALIQFRKAAELFDPKATSALAEIYAAIFDIEMRLNRPVAARAALDRARQADPAAEQLANAFTTLFGPDSRLPESARREYSLRVAAPSRLEKWKEIVPPIARGRLGESRAAWEKLVSADAADREAWFNLGLVRAWQGDHPAAIDALQKSLELDDDVERLTETGALMEVLRCGQGMQEQADYVEHRFFFRLQQPQPLLELIEQWHGQNRVTGVQADQQNGTFSMLILDPPPAFSLETAPPVVGKVTASMLVIQDLVRIWSPNLPGLERVIDEMVRKLGPALSPPMQEIGTITFAEVTSEALLVPTREVDIKEIGEKLQKQAAEYFEEVWVHRRLKSLAGLSPIEATENPALRKRLFGVVKFVEDCFISAAPRASDGQQVQVIVPYDFRLLRHKLGLSQAPVAPPTAASVPPLSMEELSAADPQTMAENEVIEAFRAAVKLDAGDIASKFARDLVGRPIAAASGDRFPFFNHLIQIAQAENDNNGVVRLLDEAEAYDQQANEGRRRNDYRLRRGKVLAKQGETERAYKLFQDLIADEPNQLQLYGSATESMLGQKKSEWATQFAEQGLEKARGQNDRDSEQYFMELLGAAKKLA